MGSENRLHEVELGLNVLKLNQEALSLDEGQGTVLFTESRLKGLPHTETGPHELYSQISEGCGDLNLCPPIVEMYVRELFDALKIKTLVLPKLTISYRRSQNLVSASICLYRTSGMEANKTKSSTNKSKEINT
jgi:hypothetical protein